MAAYAHHAMVLGYTDEEVYRFFAKALSVVGENLGMDELLPVVMEVGESMLCRPCIHNTSSVMVW